MSSPEQLNTNNESRQGLFGPAEFVRYETEGEEVQLTERYTRDGTPIYWEDFYTVSADRRVLITDKGDNTYYLLGDTLYNLGASIQNRQLMGYKYREASEPRLTIGEAAPFSQSDIKEVTFWLGRARPEDPAAQVAQPKKGESPFDRWEILLSGLPKRPVVDPPPPPIQPDKGFMTDDRGKPVVSFIDHPRAFRHGPGVPEDPTARAEVTRLSGRRARLDRGTARPTSRDGTPISPRPGVAPLNILEDYNKPFQSKDERYERFVGKKITDVPPEDRPEFMEAVEKEHDRKVRKTRNKPYEPRWGARVRDAITGKKRR